MPAYLPMMSFLKLPGRSPPPPSPLCIMNSTNTCVCLRLRTISCCITGLTYNSGTRDTSLHAQMNVWLISNVKHILGNLICSCYFTCCFTCLTHGWFSMRCVFMIFVTIFVSLCVLDTDLPCLLNLILT